ncbi:NADH-ubiquinone oxidoreductase-F iron-sulfur binding region domain-containing protein [Planotetraspora mira]|uniref:Oxidoreductase n=1 Tax=Planotetraspora mira TaxID=58121 RepID=A0A8J3X661_9ACTN|nr:NADH-ubiquinone oxidoreductase-F iron-sulfur binding region domain-containing protein [Planotetraspora mira]GII28911.1 oxidoreductase [Planotetraspora mira]
MSRAPDFLTIGAARLFHGLDRLQRLDLAAHRRIHRPPSRLSLRDLVALAGEVDLRGRGGAAFPFARKLTAVGQAAERRGTRPVVLVNATEGEPASAKDKALIARVPHLVLDGAVLTARALSAREIVVGVTDGGVPERSLRTAIKEANLSGSVRVVRLPERFITGEGGALVRGVNGETPIPPGRKVRAAESGVDGLPTLLSNAETFAQLAVLSELGPEGYRTAGTGDEPGTVLLTVTSPGHGRVVVETPTGVPLSEVLRRCGVSAGQGVMVGGYHGAWLSPGAAGTVTVSRASMTAAGAALGAGIIVPLEEGTCPLGEVARVADYLGAESAGQCGPCRLGLPAIARSFSSLAAGRQGADALSAVEQASAVVRGRGACHHPDGATRFLLSALEVFSDDVTAHVAGRGCGRPVRGLLPVPGEEVQETGLRLTVDWSRCAGHGLCGHIVPDLVQLDLFGYPVLTDAAVPPGHLRDALRAAEMCPALALGLSRTPSAAGHGRT